MSYLLENINTTIAKVLECMARDPKRAERLLGDVKRWVGELAAAQACAEVAPQGWQLVPVEPTESMVVAGFESAPDAHFSPREEWARYEAMTGCQQAAHRVRLCWAAMLAAAPAVEDSATGADAVLPPLPEPADQLAAEDGFGVVGTQNVYTADQMRAYALADRQQRGGEAPDRDAVDLARCGMELHSPGMPEYIVCAELVRIADARAALSATKGESNG